MKIKFGKDYYQLLGVHPESSDEEIKAAYRDLARMYHPDAIAGQANKGVMPDPEIFKSITEAYALLSNPQKRKEYDYQLSQSRPESSIHWLKGGKQGVNNPAQTVTKPPINSQVAQAWKKRGAGNMQANERMRVLFMSLAGVFVGILAAVIVFSIIKYLFLR